MHQTHTSGLRSQGVGGKSIPLITESDEKVVGSPLVLYARRNDLPLPVSPPPRQPPHPAALTQTQGPNPYKLNEVRLEVLAKQEEKPLASPRPAAPSPHLPFSLSLSLSQWPGPGRTFLMKPGIKTVGGVWRGGIFYTPYTGGGGDTRGAGKRLITKQYN
ncbi:hypothetical protein DSO57_1036494 [Entomophthora muscae]|uniref:Uncharacterized protein n=1 Tax=Entomophthora muscae TaxID=34485 RepID=A0ACC2U8W9_9FUNG|nr:hypothetical protein DSO57_1036494 [Entomophthora muscae]